MVYYEVSYDKVSKSIHIKTDGKTSNTIPLSELSHLDAGKQKQKVFFDMIKDGPSRLTVIRDLFEEDYQPDPKVSLKSLVNEMTAETQDKSFQKTWTKEDDGEEPRLEIKNLFFDSGLHLGYLANNTQRDWFNVANVVIDPLTRNAADTSDVWPEVGSTITLKSNFLELFGFPGGTELTSKCVSKDVPYQFDYTISVLGMTIDRSNVGHWVIGNRLKNQRLEDPITNENKKELQAFCLVKEMGDVFQVLIMYVWSKITDKTDRTDRKIFSYMSTCDTAVDYLCRSLNLPCIRSRVSRDKSENISDKYKDRNKVKVYTLDIFQPHDFYQGDLQSYRLQKTIEEVWQHNAKQISLVRSILNIHQNVLCIDPKYSSTDTFSYSSVFYQTILDVFTQIQEQLKVLRKNQHLPVNQQQYLNDVKLVKKRFKLYPVFRVPKGVLNQSPCIIFLVLHKNKWTEEMMLRPGKKVSSIQELKENELKKEYKSRLNQDSSRAERLAARASAINNVKTLVRKQEGGMKSILGKRKTKIDTASSKKQKTNKKTKMIDYWFYTKPIRFIEDEIESDNSDMNAVLRKEIWENIPDHPLYEKWAIFVSVYSNLLFEFDMDDEVHWDLLSEKVTTIIGDIGTPEQILTTPDQPVSSSHLDISPGTLPFPGFGDGDGDGDGDGAGTGRYGQSGGKPNKVLRKIYHRTVNEPGYFYSRRFKVDWKELYPYRNLIGGSTRVLYRNIRRMVRYRKRLVPKHS